MSRGKELFSIIVPAYLQEKNIESYIRQLIFVLTRLDLDYEIIIVVDGNEDKTLENSKKIKSSHLKTIGYKHNKGKGYAVRYGMARAKGKFIAFVDVGDISLDSISMLFEHFRWYNADIVVGSKRHPVSKITYPFERKLLSMGYQMITRLLFGLNIKDTQVGLKIYRRQVLEDVLPRLLVKQFAFDIEILAVAHHLGYTRIFEAPVDLDFSGISSITSKNYWRVIIRVFWDTLAVFYRLKILHYYDTNNRRKWRFDPELNYRINLP